MVCECCGVDAPTRKVSFYQNIGLLVIFMYSSTQGRLCKNCIHQYFWKHTLITAFMGWWGFISLVLTPIFLLNNIIQYIIACIALKPVPDDAQPAQLTDEVILQLQPYTEDIINRMNREEELEKIVMAIAKRSKVSAWYVVMYIQFMIEEFQKAELEELQEQENADALAAMDQQLEAQVAPLLDVSEDAPVPQA